MTAFVLVSEAHTGGWIWQYVTERLHRHGMAAYPVTLTGMGEGAPPAAPDTDLDTHVEDLVRLLDAVTEPQVVLVGHGYAIHPVLGAADRRPERVERIVYLDVAIPCNGDPALALVQDPRLRQCLEAHQAGVDVTGTGAATASIPPPQGESWQYWGSTAGLSPEQLAELDRRAAPQPARTLTSPLHLTGAAAAIATTGVLCTGNGGSIAALEAMLAVGDPRFQALADPQVTFFELDTGHWPMLSTPGELADVLRKAAAGDGYRLDPEAVGAPVHLRRFLLDGHEQDEEAGQRECVPERHGRLDLYPTAADGPRPAVLFVHGGPVPHDPQPTPRDWPTLVGYARLAARSGVVGVTVDHRYHDLVDLGTPADDVAAAIEQMRADPRVDPDRIALWFFSSSGLLSARWLAAPPPWLRCVSFSYPMLAPLPNWTSTDPRFRPVSALSTAGRLPLVLTTVSEEGTEIAATVEEFLVAADRHHADVTVVDVLGAGHGFETVADTAHARDAVRQAMREVVRRLQR